MKKKLALLLAILTVLSSLTLLPATAAQNTDALADTGLSEGDYDYIVLGSDAYITDCRATGSVMLPATLGGYAVYGTQWSDNERSFSSVTVPDGICDIQGSFNSPNLTSVKFLEAYPNFTGNVFGHCPKLTSVTFASDYYKNTNGIILCSDMDQNEVVGCLGGTSGTVTILGSYQRVCTKAFDGCSKITAANVSDGVAQLDDDAFINCDSLKTYTFYGKNTAIGNHAVGYRLNGDSYEKLDGVVINGYNGSNAQNYASENGFTFKEITAEAPVITKMQAVSDGVQLSWKAVEGFGKYGVFWKDPNISGGWHRLAVVSGTSFVDKSAKQGYKRLYTVRCTDNSGNVLGKYNKNGWLFTYYTTPKVAMVTNSAYSTGSFIFIAGGKIKEYYNDEKYYDSNEKCVLYRKEKGGSWTTIAEYEPSADEYLDDYRFFHDSKAVAGKTYYYFARMKNVKTGVFYSAPSATFTYKHTAAPRITQKYNVNGGIRLGWTKVKGAVKYRVFVLNSGKWTALATVSGLSYTDRAVTNAQFKKYTVRAIDNNGKYLGGYSNTVELKELSRINHLIYPNAWCHAYYPPITVKKLAKAKVGVNVTVDTPVCGSGGGYTILIYRKEGNGAYKIIGTPSNASLKSGVYNDRTAVKGKTYTYEARCYTGGNNINKAASISCRINRKSITL